MDAVARSEKGFPVGNVQRGYDNLYGIETEYGFGKLLTLFAQQEVATIFAEGYAFSK